MKKIIASISIFCICCLYASEGISDQVAAVLKQKFLREIDAYYEKLNTGLKACEPEGSQKRKKEEKLIRKAIKYNRNMNNFFHFLSFYEIGAQFKKACKEQVEGQLRYVIFHPTDVETIVFDSLQLPESFAYCVRVLRPTE